MSREDGEEDVNIELYLLADNVVLPQTQWNKAVPRNEEVFSLSQIESLNSVKQEKVTLSM